MTLKWISFEERDQLIIGERYLIKKIGFDYFAEGTFCLGSDGEKIFQVYRKFLYVDNPSDWDYVLPLKSLDIPTDYPPHSRQ